MSLLQQIAENLGATGPVGGSWMQTIAIQEGATGPVGGSWIQAWADAVGVTGPIGGSWIQALADHYGVTGAEGDWLIGIETNTATPPPPPFDPDAQAYLDAVEAAGGTINSTITEATGILFTDLKDAGIYSKLNVFYPMIGGVYNSIRIEAKLQSSYYLTENGSWTYSSSGATTTATTTHSSYFNTQYNSFNNLTTANSSYSTYWVNTHNYTPSNDQYFSGAYSGQTELWSTNPYNSTTWNFMGYRNNEGPTFNPTTAGIIPNGGYFINSELNIGGTNTIQGMANTATYVSQAMNATTSLPNTNFFLGNISILNSPYNGIPGTYNFLHIGQGLNETEMTTLSTIINTFQTALGRNTY